MTRSRKITHALHACGHRLVFIGLLASGFAAQASGMPVFDASNWAESIAQLKQLQEQLQVQKQLASINEKGHAQHLIDRRGYRGQRSLRHQQALREQEQDVEQRCSHARTPSAMLRQACSQWVQAQNRRYNTAIVLQQQLQQREQQWLDMLDERSQLESTQSGLLQSHISRMAAFQSQLQIDLQFSQSLMQSHDSYVENLQQHYVQQLRTYFHGQAERSPLARQAQLLLFQASLKLAADKRR
ncbi:MAG: hypothetical protein ACI4NW_04835 [Stenotrophomonas sp.]